MVIAAKLAGKLLLTETPYLAQSPIRTVQSCLPRKKQVLQAGGAMFSSSQLVGGSSLEPAKPW